MNKGTGIYEKETARQTDVERHGKGTDRYRERDMAKGQTELIAAAFDLKRVSN